MAKEGDVRTRPSVDPTRIAELHRDGKGMTYAEIGRMHGVSKNTIAGIVYRSRLGGSQPQTMLERLRVIARRWSKDGLTVPELLDELEMICDDCDADRKEEPP